MSFPQHRINILSAASYPTLILLIAVINGCQALSGGFKEMEGLYSDHWCIGLIRWASHWGSYNVASENFDCAGTWEEWQEFACFILAQPQDPWLDKPSG